jgi:hypothetical protein
MVHLVLTHGRAQEFGIPQTMLEAWEPALRYGLQRAEAPFFADIPISLAYYGDYWRPDAEDVPTRGGEAIFGGGARGGPRHDARRLGFIEQSDRLAGRARQHR